MREVGFRFRGQDYTWEKPCGDVACSNAIMTAWMRHTGSWLVYAMGGLLSAAKDPNIREHVQQIRSMIEKYWRIIDEAKADDPMSEAFDPQRYIEAFVLAARFARQGAIELNRPDPTPADVLYEYGDGVPSVPIPGRPQEEEGWWSDLWEKIKKIAKDTSVGADKLMGIVPLIIGLFVLTQVATISRALPRGSR
jgi:hypothetical protein